MTISIERIKEAVETVARENGAECAILFGSYARGTATERSDIDLIFVEDTDLPFIKRLDRYFDPLVTMLKASVETLIYTPQEFESMKNRPFIKRVMEEGVVLYESGKVQARREPLADAGKG